jgi:hypothetical protein
LANHVLRVVVGRVRIGVPPGLVGKPDPIHSTKCRPQSDHAERSDLAKRFFIAGPARSEPGGREREPREREREGQGLEYPSVRLSMI